MDFPITIESPQDFDELVSERLSQEESKIAALTAENQDLTDKLAASEGRATAMEIWRADREAADHAQALRAQVAAEFGVPEDVLRGDTEDALKAHAEQIKPLLTPSPPPNPVVPTIGDFPETPPFTAEREFVQNLFGND